MIGKTSTVYGMLELACTVFLSKYMSWTANKSPNIGQKRTNS